MNFELYLWSPVWPEPEEFVTLWAPYWEWHGQVGHKGGVAPCARHPVRPAVPDAVLDAGEAEVAGCGGRRHVVPGAIIAVLVVFVIFHQTLDADVAHDDDG